MVVLLLACASAETDSPSKADSADTAVETDTTDPAPVLVGDTAPTDTGDRDFAETVSPRAKLIGSASYMGPGKAVGGADLDGDGLYDLAIYSPGKRVVNGTNGTIRGTIEVGAASFLSVTGAIPPDDVIGEAIGDGLAMTSLDGGMLLVGQEGYYVPDSLDRPGRAALFHAPLTGEVLIDDADSMFDRVCPAIPNGYNFCYLGRYASFADVDDDLDPDLLLGGVAGAALLEAPFDAEVSYDTAPVAEFSEETDEMLSNFSFAGDLDGNGLPDVVGEQWGTEDGYGGSALVYLDPIYSYNRAIDASAVVSSEDPDVQPYFRAADDFDGDGYLDMTFMRGATGTFGKQISIALGPINSDVNLDSLTLTIEAPDIPRFGYTLAALGDLNGDGAAELVIGASEEDWPRDESGSGAAFVFFGPFVPGMTYADADQVLSGDGDDRFGSHIANGSDVDGDGYDDLAVCGDGDDDGGEDAGAMWLYSGIDLLGG